MLIKKTSMFPILLSALIVLFAMQRPAQAEPVSVLAAAAAGAGFIGWTIGVQSHPKNGTPVVVGYPAAIVLPSGPYYTPTPMIGSPPQMQMPMMISPVMIPNY